MKTFFNLYIAIVGEAMVVQFKLDNSSNYRDRPKPENADRTKEKYRDLHGEYDKQHEECSTPKNKFGRNPGIQECTQRKLEPFYLGGNLQTWKSVRGN